MKEFLIEVFSTFATSIVFFHVLSAIVWVGGMIAVRFAIHYSMQEVYDPKIRLGRSLENLRRFFNLVIPFIFILVITAMLLAIGMGFKGTPLYGVVHAKEAIWTIMTLVFIRIYIKRQRAEKLFQEEAYVQAKMQLESIANKYIIINIILGLTAVYLGVVLRGF